MKKSDDSGLIAWALVMGIPIYLLMEHPVIFWLIFVPIVVLGVMKFINWLKK